MGCSSWLIVLCGPAVIDRSCPEHHRCARQCQCPARVSAIDSLIALYLDPLADSTNEVSLLYSSHGMRATPRLTHPFLTSQISTAFVNGYSAILCGLLMIDAPENEELVTQQLEDRPAALDGILTKMEEFASLHDADTQPEMVEDEAEDEQGEEGSRQVVAESIRRMVKKVRSR